VRWKSVSTRAQEARAAHGESPSECGIDCDLNFYPTEKTVTTNKRGFRALAFGDRRSMLAVMRRRLDQATVKELLNYCPETGQFFWKHRARHWFKSDRSFNSWNARWAGRRAFCS